MQLQHAEEERHSRHGQHEHDKDVLLRRPGHVTVDRVRARPGLYGRPCYSTASRAALGFCFSVLTYLADVERIEEDSIEEILEAKEHHLWIEGANLSQAMLNMNSKPKQKLSFILPVESTVEITRSPGQEAAQTSADDHFHFLLLHLR